MRGKRPVQPADLVRIFLDAYRQGAFPMADIETKPRPNQPDLASLDPDTPAPLPTASLIRWYAPDPRAILPLTDGALHIPKRLRRLVRVPPVRFTTDTCFEQVIRACAAPRAPRATRADDQYNGQWLDETLVRAYTLLHHAGFAHSIEAWKTDEPGSTPILVAGIYGVHIGSAFFAESMFCRPDLGGSNASSLCLIHLWQHLRAQGFALMDVQLANSHTTRFGVTEIPAEQYMQALHVAVDQPAAWLPFGEPTALD